MLLHDQRNPGDTKRVGDGEPAGVGVSPAPEIGFSSHAIGRIRQRFPREVGNVLEILERGVLERDATPDRDGRCRVEGLVHGRPTRIIYKRVDANHAVVVTVIGLDQRGFAFGRSR